MTAHELRLKFANSLLTDKTRKSAIATANYLRTFDDWSEATEINGIKIGEKVRFLDKTAFKHSDNFTVKSYTLFAVGVNGLFVLVYNNKKIMKVKVSNFKT